MPVLWLEHSVTALISNVSCNSCAKFGEIIISKRHLPFSVMFSRVLQICIQNVSIIPTCTSNTAISRPEFKEGSVSLETLQISLHFESSWMQ